jgi:hypothetical protein
MLDAKIGTNSLALNAEKWQETFLLTVFSTLNKSKPED